jgi:hypothetical protein
MEMPVYLSYIRIDKKARANMLFYRRTLPSLRRPFAAVKQRLPKLIGKGGERSGASQEPLTMRASEVGCRRMERVYHMNMLATMGALCACVTNPPGLGAANAQTETDLPAISYASLYPVALIFKILMAQVLVEILVRIVGTSK